MARKGEEQFCTQCRNASNNRLINIALDEVQKIEDNDEDAETQAQRVDIVAEEMERRGLGFEFVQASCEDLDIEVT